MQVKSTDALSIVGDGQFVACRIERAHLRHWLIEALPVILIIYDAPRDRALWLYVQAAFAGAKSFRAARGSERLTLHMPVEQTLDPSAVGRFRGFLQSVLEQQKGIIHHD